MMDDLTEKIQASQNKLENLLARIPGYRGYKQKEQRREADKLLRTHVARRYEEQLGRLSGIQQSWAAPGNLKTVVTLERAYMKLQLLIDRIRTASYGYAGWFDALKVDEQVLERLYEFDQAMLQGVDQIAALLDRLAEATTSEASPDATANELVATLDALNSTFSRRQEVILE